ncbi:hypothetical protein N0B44_15580 [Roseibacterium beibuensis]|uniref:Tail assembly chaperone n=1 Tax=[Roseibacterium] beibuensis TaxID=1193142 RepID=A0ABP9LBU8_9RHOB|nr:hypothetical protein [Roseibacterium beibuensis]MCS6624340.1 hypothetical protein [Roseibacterium beibuensis]
MSDLLDRLVAQAESVAPVCVSVPEWSTELYFKPLTGADRMTIRRPLGKKPTEEELIVSTLQHKAMDADGKRVFETDQAARVKMLKALDLEVVMRVLREAGQADDPRADLVSATSDDDLRALLREAGDLDLMAVADLPEHVLEAIRRVIVMREPELRDALGRAGDSGPSDPIDAVKND